MCQGNSRPDSVEICLSWSVEGQSVNNNVVCLPARRDQNLSAERGSVFSSSSRIELPIWELTPQLMAVGCGWGRIRRDRLLEAFCTLPRGIMGSWRRRDGWVSEELADNHTQTLRTHKLSGLWWNMLNVCGSVGGRRIDKLKQWESCTQTSFLLQFVNYQVWLLRAARCEQYRDFWHPVIKFSHSYLVFYSSKSLFWLICFLCTIRHISIPWPRRPVCAQLPILYA